MPDQEENEPKIKIVDRRMLSEDERTGKSNSPIPSESRSEPPKLEIIGGGAPKTGASKLHEDPGTAVSAPGAGMDAADATETVLAEGFDEDDEPLNDEEAAQMRQQVEEEQFAALEKQVGRPLTEREKDAVRGEMDRQMQSMTGLEVAPMLVQTMQEMSARAAVHLGLMPNPYTRLIARNDTEARVAVEAFSALLEVIKPRLEAQIAGELTRINNDLRSNFTRITGLPLGANPGGPRLIR